MPFPFGFSTFYYFTGQYAKAADSYRAYFKKKSIGMYLDDDFRALLQGDLEESQQISLRVLEENPHAVQAFLNLADIAFEKKQFTEAIHLYDEVLKIKPDQFDACLMSSLAHAFLGEYPQAITTLNLALRHPVEEKRITSFIKILEGVGYLEALPDRQKPFCLLAHYYRYLRIDDRYLSHQVVRYVKRAIKNNDFTADAYFVWGIMYDKEGKKNKALKSFLKAVAINPRHAEALRWAANKYSERGDILNEYKMRKATFMSASNDSFYLQDMKYVLDKLGDVWQHKEVVETFLKQHPENPEALHELGEVYTKLGDYPKSLEIYQKVLNLEPQNAFVYENIGYSNERLGNRTEAAMMYKKAIELAPQLPGPHARLAGIYQNDQQYKEAVQEYKTALDLGERNIETLTGLCSTYYAVSEFELAVKCFDSVLARDPANALAQRLLPETLNNLNLQQK